MKKMFSKFANKVATAYGVMASNGSIFMWLGQTKAPACLIKND